MTQSLLAFDTDRIQRYVFATDTLKEIRGASDLLDDLNLNQMPQIVGGTCYYSHGGGGLFKVSTSDAEDTIQQVQRAYIEQTGGAATITGVAVELPFEFDDQSDNIQALWKLLGHRLKAAKARNNAYHTSITHPFFHSCDTEGKFYATNIDTDEQQLISRVSRLKREQNRIARTRRKRPERFEDIANASTPDNYFALMVADGDELGRMLETCETLPEIKELAKGIFQSLKRVLEQAAIELAIPGNEHDILLLGGDDLVVALPADKALAYAMLVAEQFTEQMRLFIQQNVKLSNRLASKMFTLSTAVVWAHTKFPFGAWHDIAESALKFTKQQRAIRLQSNLQATDPLINFLVISSANHLDFRSYYTNVLVSPPKDTYERIIRTMRPYTIPDLRRLIGYRKDKDKLRKMPRSKLEALRRAAFQSTSQQAMLDALRVLVHWRSEREKLAVQQLIRDCPGIQGSLHFPFVCTKAPDEFDDDEIMTTYCTPLVDLAELWDFLPGGDDDAE